MFKKYASVLYSTVFSAGLFFALYALAGFYPFGEGLISWCDMNQQTIPLINTFKDIFSSGSGLFQNFSHAAGMDFYGVFFFFVASPFNLLTLFIDKADIPQFMNILVVIKLSLAGGAASWFFSKRYEKLSVIFKTALGVSYAFCGYGMLFYQNIIWLDIMILFPFLLLSCYSLLEKGKIIPLIITLSMCIIINYYISFMVILFLILFFGMKGVFKKTDKQTHIKLGASVFISLFVSGIVWLPCLLQYFSSARGDNVITGLKNAGFFTHYTTSVPVILCSALTMSVTLFAVSSGKLKAYKDKFYTILLMLIPLIIEPVNMMWHTGNYMSFPARFAFITIFLLCEITADIISDTKECEKSKSVFSVTAFLLSALCGAFLVWYTQRNFATISIYTSTLWGDNNSFEGLFCMFFIALAVYFVLYGLLRYQKITKRIFSIAVSLILVCECACSVGVYMLSTRDKFNLYNYQKVLEATKNIDDDSFYYVNMDKKFTDANQLGGFSLNSIGHYTSLNCASYMEGAKMMGYSGYWMEINSTGGSILSNAVMGVKYTLKQGYNFYYFDENEVYPNLMFSSTPLPEKLAGDRLKALDNAVVGITGKSVVTKYKSDSSVEHRVGHELYEGEVIHYTVEVNQPTELYVDCYNGFSNKLNEPINGALTVYADGIRMAEGYPYQHSNGLLSLGTYHNTTVEVSITVNHNICASSFGVFGISKMALKETLGSVRGISLTKEGQSLVGQLEKGEPTYAFLPIPYKQGLKITIGGEQVEVNKALTGFVSFNTKGLAGEIRITYVTRGFYMGLALSVIGILAVILLVIFKVKNYHTVLQKTATVCFNLLFIVFILAVYILPVVLNITA